VTRISFQSPFEYYNVKEKDSKKQAAGIKDKRHPEPRMSGFERTQPESQGAETTANQTSRRRMFAFEMCEIDHGVIDENKKTPQEKQCNRKYP
jgi:hypothetical protein